MANSNVMNNQVVAMPSSQTISIVPENGEQFNPGQKIIFNIEPEVGYLKRDSYLVWDVLVNSADNVRWTFQKNAGIHSIIDQVNIYSKETGILLEALTNYSQWVSIENQYLYDDHTQLQLKEGVGHPVRAKDIEAGVEENNPVVYEASRPHGDHPANNQLCPVNTSGQVLPMARRFCMNLRSGIFNYWDAEKIIPVLNFGGLRIEIILNKPELALQLVAPHTENAVSDAGFRKGERSYDISNKVKQHTELPPLKVVDVSDIANPAGVGQDNKKIRVGFGAGKGVFVDAQVASDVKSDEVINGLAGFGFAVGNKVNFCCGVAEAAGAGAVKAVAVDQVRDPLAGSSPTITGISVITSSEVNGVKGGLVVELEFAADALKPAAAGAASEKSSDIKVGDYIKLASHTPNYKVKSCEFRLCQVVPPPNVANALMSGLNYEYTSYDTFLNNIPSGVLRHQIPITSVASKAVAMFSHYHDSTKIEDADAPNYYDGIAPEEFNLNSVQYFINNRLYPLREYNPQSKADRCLNQNELVKAWSAIGKPPLNLGDNERCLLAGYANSYLTSRELARQGFVFDLRNAEPEIRLKFSAVRGNIIRCNTFVFSKKIVQSTATGVQVVL